MKMKRTCLMMLVLLLSASVAFAGPTKQKWTRGWGNFSEPLNYKTSYVAWSVNPTKRVLRAPHSILL